MVINNFLKQAFILLLLCIGITVSAQNNLLKDAFYELRHAENDSIAISANDKFSSLLGEYLKESSAFDSSFNDLTELGTVYSDDKKVRILSWNYSLSDGRFGYGTYLLYRPKTNKPTSVYYLSSNNPTKPNINYKYDANNWYGCLYYKVFAYKKMYFLLGYSTYNDISKIKVIDVLHISNKNISLGNEIFRLDEKSKQKQQRVVFEYSANVQMNLEYDKKSKHFVFDHLSPEEPDLEGMYQYYGPDFTFDALKLKKKVWTLQKDVDIKNKQ